MAGSKLQGHGRRSKALLLLIEILNVGVLLTSNVSGAKALCRKMIQRGSCNERICEHVNKN